MNDVRSSTATKDENRDPISGMPGAHPVGAGLGATGGGIAGAAIGSVGGPIGAGVGLVVGAVAGGFAGKAVTEQIDPTAEDAYWRENYASRPYVSAGDPYETYAPAYRTGYEGRRRYAANNYDEVEQDLRLDYDRSGDSMRLAWERAKLAVRDAWHKLDHIISGGDDHVNR